MKSLTNSEIISVNCLQEACDSPKSGHECTQKKIDQEDRRRARTEIRCGVWNILAFVNVFKEASRAFMYIFIFLLSKAGYKL
jgi:hypothetical protein